MTGWEGPGDGWHETSVVSSLLGTKEFIDHVTAGKRTRWVRDEPVPPLPTEHGAVITWDNDAYLPQIARLDGQHGWYAYDPDLGPVGSDAWVTVNRLVKLIDGNRWTELVPKGTGA